ncbi:CDP-alcohol phosphatidyltransferase family protein [Marinobacter halotolerans]|uniref:CDP-alcohol phosphatidyltransferase family protein n=1 Tax=Marinobacter halotolerans TaxID=1569211 RepID=UPI00124626FC|nr:CDP-alcohol phosphatidyltransferase family protein [Marinobacter halotolerans]
MDSRSPTFYLPLAADLVLAALLMLAVAVALGALFDPGSVFYLVLALFGCVGGGLIVCFWPRRRDFGWANRVTLARGVLVLALVSLAPFLGQLPSGAAGNYLWLYVSLSIIALLLDGVDGWTARATGTQTAFGARFDMELDALFILGLCVAILALDKAGAWVLALGLMRYGFVVAGLIWPFINRPLPDSFRRKTVCVWQLVTLMVALVPVTPDALAYWSLMLALALLCYSFGTDLRWLYQTFANSGERHETDS